MQEFATLRRDAVLMPVHSGVLERAKAIGKGGRNVWAKSGRNADTPMIEDELPEQAEDPLSAHLRAVAEHRDAEAFRALFDHFAPRLNGFLLKQGTAPAQVEDIVQETLVNVWRKARLFDPAKASASTWVFTIARNLRIDFLRKANRPMPDLQDPAFVPDPEPDAHDIMSREQDGMRLRDAIDDLPEEQQEVLRLAFLLEKPHAEVAAELNIPLGTVKSRIRLGLNRVRSELGVQL
jgi:RNA polymerase sigma-70 factor (ECF subfamily)